MNTCYAIRFSRPTGLFSFGLLDELQVRLRRPYVREAMAGFGLERLATVFMNSLGKREHERSHPLTWWREGGTVGAERKVLASGFLELGFHNNGSYSFSLGRPDPRKLETEIFALDPSHQGFVDAYRPILVVQEQGQAEHHADLHLGKGRRLTPSRGEIKDRRLALEVILSKKE